MTEFTRDLASVATQTQTSQPESLPAARTPLWVVLLGTCCGGLLMLGMSAATLGSVLKICSKTWMGMGICLASFLTAAIYQSIAARFLWRREKRCRSVLLPYLELSVTGTWLVLLVVLVGIGSILTDTLNELLEVDARVWLGHLVVASVLLGLAWCGVIRRWQTAPRLAILVGSGLLLSCFTLWGPNFVLGSAGGLAAVLGVVAVVQSRKPASEPMAS